MWAKDPSVDGYVRTCQGTKAGDPINPVYLERIQTAAVISDGRRVASIPDLLRVLVGDAAPRRIALDVLRQTGRQVERLTIALDARPGA
ncbi:MAG TPA: hypothetical protein PKC20_15190 [Burkholderiaceae bacterium]|nr:hypothetical protein [Burkholderiaceae bacterium]